MLLVLTGCTTFSEDGGFNTVRTITEETLDIVPEWFLEGTDKVETKTWLYKTLEQELSAEDAMQIALLNKPALQAAYFNLGIKEAELVQAGRFPNPEFAYSSVQGDFGERESSFGISLSALLMRPYRVNMQRRLFENEQLEAARTTLDGALSARQSYFDAVAARQTVLYLRQVLESAEASLKLVERMAKIGTSSKLDLTREALFHAKSVAALARAVQQEVSAREAFVRNLGLWGDQTDFILPDRLPALPDEPNTIENIETMTIENSLNVRLARQRLDDLAYGLKLTRGNHFINLLEEVERERVRESEEDGILGARGYRLSLEIPIFDWGGAKVAKANSIYQQGVAQLQEVAVNSRSRVREAYHAYRTAYDIAAHYRDKVLPLQEDISREQLLRYNGMLASIFELLADRREQIATVSENMQALRNFWTADTNLQRVMLGAGGVAGNASSGVAIETGSDAAGH